MQTINEIIKDIRQVEIHNSYYFMYARFNFLRFDQKKGYIRLKIKDPQQFLDYLRKFESDDDTTVFNEDVSLISYVKVNKNTDTYLKKATDKYDPLNKFVLNIITRDENGDDIETVDVIRTSYFRQVFFGKYLGIDFINKVEDTPCIECSEDDCKIFIYNPEKISDKCRCCNAKKHPKVIFECICCFSRYLYY